MVNLIGKYSVKWHCVSAIDIWHCDVTYHYQIVT